MNPSPNRRARAAPRQVASTSSTTTAFNVTNSTGGVLRGQYVLVFLQPIPNSPDYLYAAWQALNPGEGATQPFALSYQISVDVSLENGTTSAAVGIQPGQLSEAVNPGGLSPVLDPPAASSLVTAQQAGVQNTTSPFEFLNVSWFVDGDLVATTSAPLTEDEVSAMEYDDVLYWAVGDVTQGTLVTSSEITPMASYAVPAGAAQIDVDVTFDTITGFFVFTFTPVS
jgi:hypothetical protein